MVNGNSQVTLSWSISSDAGSNPNPTSYNVKRATATGGPYTSLGTLSGIQYLDMSAVNGLTYYYVVTAVRQGIESIPSNEVIAHPSVSVPILSTLVVGNGHLGLTWSVSLNAVGYVINRAEKSGIYTQIASVSSSTTSYLDTSLINGKTYYYEVFALNTGGGSVASNEVSGKPKAPARLSAPTSLTAMAGNSAVWLQWQGQANNDYQYYNIKRSNSGSTSYDTIASVGQATVYKDFSVINGTQYHYFVTAVNDGIESTASNRIEVTPHLPSGNSQDLVFNAIGIINSINTVEINDATQVADTQFAFGLGLDGSASALYHASLFDNSGGYQFDLGTLGGDTVDSYSTGINNAGQVIGSAQDSSFLWHTFLWDKILGMRQIGDFSASQINDNGDIAGADSQALVYSNGQIFHMGTLVPDPNNTAAYLGNSSASGSNNSGVVVGSSNISTSYDLTSTNNPAHAFLHQGYTPLSAFDDLGTLGGTFSEAAAVNDFGQAVGSSILPNGEVHACLWDGGIHDLGTLGGHSSAASAINDKGQIVGTSQTVDGHNHAFIYQNGMMTDLNSYLSPTNQSSPWDDLFVASSINNKGEIVGFGNNTGYGRIFLMSHSTPSSADPCDQPTVIAPATFAVNSKWGDGKDWTMTVEVSPKDGLVLHNIKLGHRYMAQKISVPYFTLKTSVFSDAKGHPVHAELKPNGTDSIARSRLINFEVSEPQSNPMVITATYSIDRISNAGADSCLSVTQRYEFYRETSDNEPSQYAPLPDAFKFAPLQSSAFKPIVEYAFHSTNGETLTSINIPQRCYFKDDNIAPNVATLYQDIDDDKTDFFNQIFHFQLPSIIKAQLQVPAEMAFTAIQGGLSANSWDNWHQTYNAQVDGPSTFPAGPGCPECVHIHWRWSKLATKPTDPNYYYGGGLARIPPGSNQDVEIAVTKYKAGEDHPNDFHALLNSEALAGQNLVFWYSGTGHQAQDRFFTHGGFFSATGDELNSVDMTITADPLANSLVTVGDTVELTYHIQNLGGQDATNPSVTDIIPDGMTLVGATCDTNNEALFVQNGDNTVNCLFGGFFAAGQVETIHIFLKATVSGQKTNTIGVGASENYNDPNPANNKAVQMFTVE